MSDLISRQWLLDLYGKYIDGDVEEGKALFVPLEVVRQNIKDAPSEDRPKGKWIPKLSSEDKVRRYECSICGYVHIKHPYTVEFFCPNCGAKIEV